MFLTYTAFLDGGLSPQRILAGERINSGLPSRLAVSAVPTSATAESTMFVSTFSSFYVRSC